MHKFNPKIHHRRSIRLKGYDYTRPGAYFITICVQDRLHLFGEIHDGNMILNDAGKMIEKWYFELENKFPDKKCREMVVMPNHFHCIIENMVGHVDGRGAHVGAPRRGRPDTTDHDHPDTPYGPENKKFNATVGDAMDWFKTMTINEYIRGVKNLGWKRFNRKLWHRNYWEHIIRDDRAYFNISNYILNNPKNWKKDCFI